MMTTADKVPGKRLFVAGCITLLLFSAVHMIPMCIGLFGEPKTPQEVEVQRALAAIVIDMGPFHTDWGKLNQLLNTCFSTLLFFVVALNLVSLPAVTAPPPYGRFRAMTVVNVIFVGIILVLAVIFQFPPPLAFSLIAEGFFIAALVKATTAVRS